MVVSFGRKRERKKGRKKEGRKKEGGREEEKEENGKHCLKDTGQSIGLNKGYV